MNRAVEFDGIRLRRGDSSLDRSVRQDPGGKFHIVHLFTDKALHLCTRAGFPGETPEDHQDEISRLLQIKQDMDISMNLGMSSGVVKLGFETEDHQAHFMAAAYKDMPLFYEPHEFHERVAVPSLVKPLGELALTVAASNRLSSAVVIDPDHSELVICLRSAGDKELFLEDYNSQLSL